MKQKNKFSPFIEELLKVDFKEKPLLQKVFKLVKLKEKDDLQFSIDEYRCLRYSVFWAEELRKMGLLKGVICHELLHLYLGHVFEEPRYPKLWNDACDAVVNRCLLKSLEKSCLAKEIISNVKHGSTYELYEKLCRKKKLKPPYFKSRNKVKLNTLRENFYFDLLNLN